MIPAGARSLRVVVAGPDAVVGALSSGEEAADRAIRVEGIGTEDVTAEAVAACEADCLVVDCRSVDAASDDIVERWVAETDAEPVVLLIDATNNDRGGLDGEPREDGGGLDEETREDGDDLTEGLSGAMASARTVTLPRALAGADEDRFADRVVAAVERRRADGAVDGLYDAVDATVTVHDPDSGALVHANRSACDALGYDRETLLATPLADLLADVPENDREQVRQVVSSVTARTEPVAFEWALRTADGDVRWFEADLRTLELAGRRVVLATSEDVTERRRQEHRYEAVFENVNDVITVHDPWAGELVQVNDSLCELTGYGRDALLEMGVDGFSATDEGFTAERAYDMHRTVAATGDAETADWVVETANGERRRLECVLSPARIAGEDRVLVLGRDVTERRQLEETYEDLFENVSDGLVIHDLETGEIRDVNERFCELYGYDREGLVGESVDVVTAPEHGLEAAQERIRAAREEGPQLFEWRGERRDGTTFPVEVHLSVVEVRGTPCVLASVRDITERRRREREYEQVFHGVTEGIAIQDPETGELVDANQPFVERLGYEDLETVLEQDFATLSASEEGYTKERAKALCQRVMATGEPETVEWRQRTADGETRWIEAKVNPAVVRGEERVVSMQRDVTERRQREREYEQIFNSVNDAIAVFDPETAEIVDVNDSYHEMVGYEDLETIQDLGIEGLSLTEAGYTADRAADLIREAAETGEATTVDWRAETRDGERIWLEATLTPAEIGGERRVLSLQRDVTEQRVTERRLAAIVDRIDEAIFMTKAAAIAKPDVAPEYVSSGYESIWGQSFDEIHERYDDGFFGTLHPADESDYRRFVEDVVGDVRDGVADDRYSQAYRIERPDGEVRWVRSDYYSIEWEGEQPRVVIVSRDVTHQKARERRIASFEDATEDLATADAPAEATRTAVEAAVETLDLPAVGAFLYDGEAGVLDPAVLAGPLPDAVATDPVRPGDGPLWEGFAAGTVVASDGGDGKRAVGPGDAPAALDDLADWRAIALGNHGVLVVGSPERTFDSEAIQAAHVLAATLEAALNHLQGQQRLAAQEEALRTQTERAERLDRIARLSQQVEAAITDASTPREVERAVCERLASSGPYELAWVGGLDVGSDRLSARSVVGAPERYIDGLTLTTTDDTADPHPAVAAWQTDEVRVTDSIVDSGPAGDWRQQVLSAGYQSVCAVPLSYDGITHGVLTVATGTPNAFGDREREVLAQLGTSIGDAIVAIERRRALESDETVELEFRGAGGSLSFAQAAATADCRVRLERTVARQDGSVSVYFSFERGVPADVGDVARDVLQGDVDVVADDPSSTLVEVRTDDWFGSPLAEYGGVLREARAEPGETTVVVEVPQQADVRSFVERLQAVAPSLDLVARRQHSRRSLSPAELGDRVREELTDRQFEVLQTALSAGYFEWPRENDGGAVADRLGITQPTLNKHLRLAERQIFSLLLDGDASTDSAGDS
jgi:PAS domain S-box-containing protein